MLFFAYIAKWNNTDKTKSENSAYNSDAKKAYIIDSSPSVLACIELAELKIKVQSILGKDSFNLVFDALGKELKTSDDLNPILSSHSIAQTYNKLQKTFPKHLFTLLSDRDSYSLRNFNRVSEYYSFLYEDIGCSTERLEKSQNYYVDARKALSLNQDKIEINLLRSNLLTDPPLKISFLGNERKVLTEKIVTFIKTQSEKNISIKLADQEKLKSLEIVSKEDLIPYDNELLMSDRNFQVAFAGRRSSESYLGSSYYHLDRVFEALSVAFKENKLGMNRNLGLVFQFSSSRQRTRKVAGEQKTSTVYSPESSSKEDRLALCKDLFTMNPHFDLNAEVICAENSTEQNLRNLLLSVGFEKYYELFVYKLQPRDDFSAKNIYLSLEPFKVRPYGKYSHKDLFKRIEDLIEREKKFNEQISFVTSRSVIPIGESELDFFSTLPFPSSVKSDNFLFSTIDDVREKKSYRFTVLALLSALFIIFLMEGVYLFLKKSSPA